MWHRTLFRWVGVPLAAACASLGLTVAAATPAAASTQTLTTAAEADAYIAEGTAATAYGSVDPGNCKVLPLFGNRNQCRFRVAVAGLQPGDTVIAARVLARPVSGAGTKAVQLSYPGTPPAPWDEGTLTWATRQLQPPGVATQSDHVPGVDSSWTVAPSVITGNGPYEFSLWAQSATFAAISFATKETGTAPGPRLELTVDRPAAPSAPVAALSVAPASGAAPLDVVADASGSTDADGDPLTYAFDWGDGSTTPAQPAATAPHTYAAAGTFTVTVTAADPGGLQGTATAMVEVSEVTPPYDPDARVAYGWNLSESSIFLKTSSETPAQWHARQVASWSAQTVGGYQSGKVFYPTIPTVWNAAKEGQVDGRRVVLTYRQTGTLDAAIAGGDDARLRGYIASIPAGWDVSLAFWNEADLKVKDGTLDQVKWRQAFAHQLGVVRTAPHAAGTRVGLWASFTTPYTSGYSAAQAKAILPPDLDGISWDNYVGNPAGQGGTGYNSQYGPSWTVRSQGVYDVMNLFPKVVPIGWDEIGAPWRTWDTDASARSAWLTSSVNYLAAGFTHAGTGTHVQPRRVLIFNADGTQWTQSFLADNLPSLVGWDQGVRPTDADGDGDEPFVKAYVETMAGGAVDPFSLTG